MYGVRGVGRLAIFFWLLLLVGCGGGGSGGTGGSGGPELCQSPSDCSTDRPHCEEGVCVACRMHRDCDPSAPICREGSCTGCAEDAECPGARCDTGSGQCVACLDDADCGDGRCTAEGVCVACLVDGDCGEGQVCSDENLCVPAGMCEQHTDCGTNELCVIADGAPVGRCGSICDPEKRHADCAAGKKCEFIGFDEQEGAIGACLHPTGGAGEQESCLNVTCDTGLLCVTYNEAGTDKRCTSACDAADPESCGRGFTCFSIDFTSPAGASMGLCVPVDIPCESDVDCSEDEVCNLALGEEGGVVRICSKKAGNKAGGAKCSTHAECESNWCLAGQGVCFGFCDRPADCHSDSTCVDVTFTIDEDDSESLPVCFPTCGSDGDCPSTQSCVYVHSHRNDELVNICNGKAGSKGPGEPCERGSECSTGSCSFEWGICEGLCESDLDCRGNTTCTAVGRRVDSGRDGLWSTPDDTYQMLPLCRGMECTKDSDCGGWLCVPEIDHRDPDRDSLGMRCTPPKPGTSAGLACSSDSQCATGRCFDPRVGREDCFDGIDNDGDGLVDCADPLCATACFTEVDCGNGIDDDGDGAIDCADADCYWDCYWGEANCHDGIDNDGNGLIDCEDPECKYACNLNERNCKNGRDDDGDGFVDCDDPDCFWEDTCQALPIEGRDNAAECSDGIDNDGDGLVDCADPHCADKTHCKEVACATGNCCTDGIDNDGNGLIDCFDRSCENDPACNEANCGTGDCCTDGIDNDGNGAIDCADYTCRSHPSCVETNCTDGLDNDGDRLVDCADPDCIGTPACGETNCTDGIDNDGDGLADCADPDCFSRSHCAERICYGACVRDEDCGTGFVCAQGIHPVRMEWEGRWEFVPACVPARFTGTGTGG